MTTEPNPLGAGALQRPSDSALTIYIAAATGGLFVTLADLIKNDPDATTARLSVFVQRVLRQPEFDPLFAVLVIVVALGVALAWVHRPHSRVDGFLRGASVFAAFAVLAPTPGLDAASGATVSFSQLSDPLDRLVERLDNAAFAQEPGAHAEAPDDAEPDRPTEGREKPRATVVRLVGPDSRPLRAPEARIRVWDARTGRLVGTAHSARKVRLRLPDGRYQLTVEAPGYRRTDVGIAIRDDPKSYELQLEPSGLPIWTQRLGGLRDQGSLQAR